VVADELHRWKTRKQLENWDVLSLGGVTRRQPLTIAITTAGVQNESPLAWRLHEKTRRIEDGVVQDPAFVGRIFGANEKDDWTAESTWIKANPSLKQRGGFLDIARIREKYDASLSDPESQSAFRRYYLNIWNQKENRVIDLARWDASVGSWTAAGLLPKERPDKVRELAPSVLEHFAGRRCWAGVDLSMTTDLSAVAFVFTCDDGGFDVLPFFWTPEGSVRKRELRDGMPYSRWADQGFIELSAGDVIDYREVKARLEWASQIFDLREICFDPWNSRQISVPLVEEGYTCIEIRQGIAMLSEPSKKLLELVTASKLRHGGHPVLRWNASCLAAKETNDNLMFTKPPRSLSSSRIDGISATVNALVRAIMDKGDGGMGQIEIW
jgi:phage terminase large subunit-like protein